MDALIEKGKGTLIENGMETIQSILNITKNIGILEKKVEELSCHERDVQDELHIAQVLYGQKPKNEVELWLRKVQRIKGEVPDIRQKVGELRWFHFLEQMNLAKYVEEKIKEVVELRENGPILSGLFVSSLSSSAKEFPLVKVVGEETALKNMKKIEECLVNDEVGKIGVFGMGGVGKTTLMTQIYNKIKNANAFVRVIWVTVSRDSYLEKLQYDVSKELCLNLSNDHAIDRAAELFGVFKRMGRFLLILDDMWDAFPLEKIGIPEPNEENKCKIVWTTRSKTVCEGMGSYKLVTMECLTEDESWTLFQEKLDGNPNMTAQLEPIAKDVVTECDGLPLAIITIGAAMKGVHDVRKWRNAREVLRNSRAEKIKGMEDHVFKCLKFSFDKLESPRFQDCFLYCALYPEDHEIDCQQLIEYWMADGLLDENEDRNKGFDEGYAIIDDLKNACMLESGSEDDRVKMHDLLRDLAIDITRKSCTFVVKTGFREKQILLDENLMTDAGRVSLMSSSIIEMLSVQPKSYAKLSTLLLYGCHKLKDIPPLFFEHMPNLRVLDLSSTGIVCLPQSISNLRKLRVLSLTYSFNLKEVPSLARLKELRVLWLTGTPIKHLPEGLECLTKLRCLFLDDIELETFPAGILPNLSCLEELATDVDTGTRGWRWSSNEKGGGACFEEMLGLTHLRRLYAHFDLNSFNCYVRSENQRNLKYFCLCVSISNEVPERRVGIGGYDPRGRTVRIINDKCLSSSLVFPDKTLELEVVASDDVTSLSEISSMWTLEQLSTCGLYSCEKLEYILAKDRKNPFLPTLNKLKVYHSRNLRSICKDLTPTESGSLASLKTVYISDCSNLKFVFSVGWLQALQNLEEISVFRCGPEMEEMVVETEEDMDESSNNNDNAITLPRLKILRLTVLPKLKSISKRTFICNSLEGISVKCCPNLKKLPLSINSTPSSLKWIEGSNEWWDSLEWDNPDTRSHLQPFFKGFDVTRIVDQSNDDENNNAEEEEDGGGGAKKTDVLVSDEEEDNENNDAEGEEDCDDVAVAVEEEEKRGMKRKADALM